MRFIVCGGRHYAMPRYGDHTDKKKTKPNKHFEAEYETVFESLLAVRKLCFETLIYGGHSTGVDLVASGIWSQFLAEDRASTTTANDLGLLAVPERWDSREQVDE